VTSWLGWLGRCAGVAGVVGSSPVESPEFFGFVGRLLENCPATAGIISSFDITEC